MWGLEGAAAAWAAYTSARHIATAARVLAIMRGPSLPRASLAAAECAHTASSQSSLDPAETAGRSIVHRD
jgi:hypothetical protein